MGNKYYRITVNCGYMEGNRILVCKFYVEAEDVDASMEKIRSTPQAKNLSEENVMEIIEISREKYEMARIGNHDGSSVVDYRSSDLMNFLDKQNEQFFHFLNDRDEDDGIIGEVPELSSRGLPISHEFIFKKRKERYTERKDSGPGGFDIGPSENIFSDVAEAEFPTKKKYFMIRIKFGQKAKRDVSSMMLFIKAKNEMKAVLKLKKKFQIEPHKDFTIEIFEISRDEYETGRI